MHPLILYPPYFSPLPFPHPLSPRLSLFIFISVMLSLIIYSDLPMLGSIVIKVFKENYSKKKRLASIPIGKEITKEEGKNEGGRNCCYFVFHLR